MMEFPQPKQWEPLAVVPILAGMAWLTAGEGAGWFLLALTPGALLLATGVALLLWPGDLRIQEFMALGGLAGLLLSVPALIPGSFVAALLCALLSIGAFLVAGWVGLSAEPPVDEVPTPARDFRLCTKAALDEALLAYFIVGASMPESAAAQRLFRSLDELDRLYETAGWHEHPERFHHAPAAPQQVEVADATLYNHPFQRLRFPSGFEPDERLPGAGEWNRHLRNEDVHAWLLRHPGPPRPWLLCLHGYRMGEAWLDLLLFQPRWLHHELGLNLILPVLPLHGPRRTGLRSGSGFLDYDLLNLLHAQTQALWDLRRTVAWVREQSGGEHLGVLGYSLGGYNAALLAAHQSDLDLVIAGIPVTDFAAALWRHVPPPYRRYFEVQGLDRDRYGRILHPVSPLARPCAVPAAGRAIFAGVADRVVLPEHPLALSRHWQTPVEWYQGGHLTFRGETAVKRHIEATMQRAGWSIRTTTAPS